MLRTETAALLLQKIGERNREKRVVLFEIQTENLWRTLVTKLLLWSYQRDQRIVVAEACAVNGNAVVPAFPPRTIR